MIYAFGSHPVQNFDTWKPVFDSDQPRAEAAGIHCVKLFRSIDNPNEVNFLFTAASMEAFDQFIHDPVLPELMKSAGVLAPPSFRFFNEVSL